ncbi:MAG: hypothetical protein RMY28_009430 [Nostoc sp. ChiSLP01]|nr:hypothetical protein [Nostoc sp. CmiSLP01]MDZ8285224.1 hypothetical protein [Nostoc sp. ChiSLP01]
MAKQTTLYLTQGYNHAAQTFANADDTTTKLLIAADADDSKITSISITSSATTALDILFYLYNGTTDYLIGHIDIPANSGFDGTVYATNGLNRTNLPWLELDGVGNPYIKLKGGWSLRAAMKTTISSGTVTVLVTTEDF